jgi:hypothetical protein
VTYIIWAFYKKHFTLNIICHLTSIVFTTLFHDNFFTALYTLLFTIISWQFKSKFSAIYMLVHTFYKVICHFSHGAWSLGLKSSGVLLSFFFLQPLLFFLLLSQICKKASWDFGSQEGTSPPRRSSMSLQWQNSNMSMKAAEVGVHACKRKQNWWHQPHATLIETKKIYKSQTKHQN